MKVFLQNFKCWEKKEIDFGTEQMTLLSGKSGVGKTSIMDAIIFALFGIGSKLVMQGKSSCKVILEIKHNDFDIEITRTKRPNRVVVTENKNNYEDDAAQEIINKYFSNNFQITGYIRQNSFNSFILLSPIEKLAFLERFAFADTDLSKCKKKTKELIKERQNTFIAVTSQLEMTENFLKEKEKPQLIEYPIKCKNKEKAEKNHLIKIKNNNKKLSHVEKGIDILKNKLEATNQLDLIKSNNNNEIKRIDDRLEQLSSYNFEEDHLSSQKEQIQKLKDKLEKTISHQDKLTEHQKWLDNKKQYSQLFQTEHDNLLKEKTELEKKILNEDLSEDITNYKLFISGLEQMTEKKERIQELNDKLDNNYNEQLDEVNNKVKKLEKDIEHANILNNSYECPSCSKLLTLDLQTDQLICCEDIDTNDIKDIKKLTKKLTKYKEKYEKLTKKVESLKKYSHEKEILEKDISDFIEEFETDGNENISELQNDLEKMEEEYHMQKVYKKKITKIESKIESGILSDTLNILKQQIDSYDENLIDQFENLDLDKENLEELRNKINTLSYEYNESKIYLKEYNRLKDRKKEYKSVISEKEKIFLEKYKTYKNVEELESKIEKYSNQFEELKNVKEELSNISDQLEKYKYYEKEINEYNSWVKKQDNLQSEEIVTRDKLSASKMLKEKITEAESIAITNLIEQINSMVQPYLELFFEDNPIMIRIDSFKEDRHKNKKPQINLQIEYKGMECDLNMLSGGEIQRIVIAFNLALSEMFNLPCLLLDECTSNLDQETTEVIVSGIKEHFSHKNVIVIAHQVVAGLFDKVIEIK